MLIRLRVRPVRRVPADGRLTLEPRLGLPSPPKGSTLGTLDGDEQESLANPLAVSVCASSARSSSAVMWPMMQMCAPVAIIGSCFVRVRSVPESHASRIVADSVLPWPLRVPKGGCEFGFNDEQTLVDYPVVHNLSDRFARLGLWFPRGRP